MADAFTNRYEEFLDGNYDCVDRIVINAYLPGVGGGGGFRNWWRSLYGSEDKLDKEHRTRGGTFRTEKRCGLMGVGGATAVSNPTSLPRRSRLFHTERSRLVLLHGVGESR